MSRQEDIEYNFAPSSDRIWPPSLATSSFLKALYEVLSRLPDDAFDSVCERIYFVIEDSRVTAVNVPFHRLYPPRPEKFEVSFDTIVIFCRGLAYPHSALVGLLAHEIAHSFTREPNYMDDEAAADSLVQQWGFEKEIAALMAERQKSTPLRET